jgi:hypothetical protein
MPRDTVHPTMPPPILHTYTLAHDGTPASYDESLAVACLQGIINRDAPRVYVMSPRDDRPAYWLRTLGQGNAWLAGAETHPLKDLDALRALAGDAVRGAIVWDPAVPATVNVATTAAGVEDAVTLSPELADRYAARWGLPILHDLRGRFTGAETGSAKNDAYRWAIRQYLAPGRCSSRLLCLFEDAFTTRARGDISYILTRDHAVRLRSFVFDLSPWGDEVPGDDPNQPLGADLATYKIILEEVLKHTRGRHMTELSGFFAFAKYSRYGDHESIHEPVPTEWETVWLISPYNGYQNTISSDCYNQSIHCHAPRRPLKQPPRPKVEMAIEKKTYLCFLMADYDSATPLYSYMPKNWDDPGRGKIPLCWGIDPNLVETYPDVIRHLYQTATPNDYFASDASAAGYMNPNRIRPEYMKLFIDHNRRFFQELDMSMAPMVLDWDEPTPEVKDAFTQFAPDGLFQIVIDYHDWKGRPPTPHVWKGMPVGELYTQTGETFVAAHRTAEQMSTAINERGAAQPGFYFFRVVWATPSNVIEAVELLRAKRPELDIEVLHPHVFAQLFKRHFGG